MPDRAMTDSNQDSTISLPLPMMASATLPTVPSEIEDEVISLFDQLQDRLFGYVLSFGVSVHDAEDIVQETFLSLFRHLQLQRSRRNLRGWIFRVGHNLALKRRQANQKVCETAASDWTIAERQCDPAPDPEEQLSFKQRRTRLLAVLAAFPEEEQCCLRLRAEGVQYREIAEVLGMSLGAVSNSLTRSLARLMRA